MILRAVPSGDRTEPRAPTGGGPPQAGEVDRPWPRVDALDAWPVCCGGRRSAAQSGRPGHFAAGGALGPRRRKRNSPATRRGDDVGMVTFETIDTVLS